MSTCSRSELALLQGARENILVSICLTNTFCCLIAIAHTACRTCLPYLQPTGKPSPSTPSGHLAVPFGRPNTGRQCHRGAQPTASPGRRGSWLSNESKSGIHPVVMAPCSGFSASWAQHTCWLHAYWNRAPEILTPGPFAAPDEAAVRRILAEPSAYAQRPATAGVAHRAVGG